MIEYTCRLCNAVLPGSELFALEPVPAGVQYFPSRGEEVEDKPSRLAVYQCESCGLVQLESEPVMYGSGTTSATAYSETMMRIRRQQMSQFVAEYRLQGKAVLDIGCGDGHLLQHIHDAGAQAIGIDASQSALEIARDRGFAVHHGYIAQGVRIPGSPFDAFVSNDVIEHVPNLRDFLAGIRDNLKDGAVGIIETPNFQKVLNENRFYDFIRDHLSYFIEQTLTLALELNGFEVLRIKRTRDDENLEAVVRKRSSLNLEKMTATREDTIATLEEFFERHRRFNRQVAVWGASLQTLTLSTLTAFDTIRYIIDSAPYKQNRITPVSHLPIVAADTLQTDPVDVILVIAPRYSDEIIKQIQHDCGFSGLVALLDGSEICTVQEAQ